MPLAREHKKWTSEIGILGGARVAPTSAEVLSIRMGVKAKKARSARRRTQHPMTARLVYVEPWEDDQALAERVWAMLLGESDEDVQNRFSIESLAAPAGFLMI